MGRPAKTSEGASFDVHLWGVRFQGIPLEFEGESPSWKVPAMGTTYRVRLEPNPSGGKEDVVVSMPAGPSVKLPPSCLREITDNPNRNRRVLFVSNASECVGILLGRLAITPRYAAAFVGKHDAVATADSRQVKNFDVKAEGVVAFRSQHGSMFEEIRLVSALTGIPEEELLATLHHEGRFNIDAVNLELGKTLPLIRRTAMYQQWVEEKGKKGAEAEAVRFIKRYGFGDRGVGHFYKEPVLKKGRDGKWFVSNVAEEGETWKKVAQTGECASIWKQLFPDKPIPKGRQESFFFSTLATACLMRKDSQRYNIPLTASGWHPKGRRLAFRGQGGEIAATRRLPSLTDPYTQLVFSLQQQLGRLARR